MNLGVGKTRYFTRMFKDGVISLVWFVDDYSFTLIELD